MKETSQRLAAGARLPEHAAALGLRLLADDDAGLRAADEAGVVRVRVVSWSITGEGLQHVLMPGRCCNGRGDGLRPGEYVKSIGASVIDLLANSKIRLDSVKRMTQILNTS